MIFKIEKNNRAFPVFLAQDINEQLYFEKNKTEDNLHKEDFFDQQLLNYPLILKEGVIVKDEQYIIGQEQESKKELVKNILSFTDKFMIEDFPITLFEKEEIKKYRQELRNFSKNGKFPTQPEFLNRFYN